MSTPDKPGKAMSSRLLTMKFMQRAAATSPQTAPSTPDARPAKRPRYSLPARVEQDARNADMAAIQAALVAEEAKRQKALDRQAHDAGDTKWTLGLEDDRAPPLLIVNAGYSEIDSPSRKIEDEVSTKVAGRMRFGKFEEVQTKSDRKRPAPSDDYDSRDEDEDSNSGDGEDSEEDVEEDADSKVSKLATLSGKQIHAPKRKSYGEDGRQDSSQRAERRQQKRIKLSDMTSISGGGLSKKDSPWPKESGKTCFRCGSPGHMKSQCPQAFSRKPGLTGL